MLFPGVSWQCYQTLPLVHIKILLQKDDASILFNIRALIWQWRRPDRPDMTDNCNCWQLKLPLKIKGWITEKGSAFQLVPCTRAHILNIWMRAQENIHKTLQICNFASFATGCSPSSSWFILLDVPSVIYHYRSWSQLWGKAGTDDTTLGDLGIS